MAERGLHVGIDGRELVGQPTGVGRYLHALLQHWTSPDRLSIYVPAEPPPALRALANGDRVQVVVDASGGRGTWWEQTHLPRLVARTRPDVLFAAGYTAPLWLGCPMVVAIYDVSYFAHPEWFPAREGARRRWLTRVAARRARRVVTISEFSASEIARWIGIPRDRIVIAPPGAPAAVATTARRRPTVLYVGSLFNRRRIPDLIRVFTRVAERVPEARLVLVGDNRTYPKIDPQALANEAGIGHRFEWKSYATEAELEALYSEAGVFVFLSEYEGFGMTPLEAIAHGVPAVVLDTAVAREVYAEGACYVGANLGTLADTLVSLLTDRPAHSAMARAGQARLQHFSWARSAQAVREALAGAAAGR